MYKKIGIIILAILLILSNIYLYTKVNKSDYDITVGIPTVGENNDIVINFSDFNPISNKDEFNIMTFYLMDANITNKPNICENTPDLVIAFNNNKDKIQYYKVNIWINGNSLIVKANNEYENDYKIIEGHRYQEIIKIIEKYKKNYR